jgi:hypothetical protein
MTDRRLWWLTVYEPTTGCATRVVGVAGADAAGRYLSWLPHEDDVRLWLERLGPLTAVTAVHPDRWAELADGVVVGMIPIDEPPETGDLAGSVEAAVDGALVAAITTQRAIRERRAS